MARTNTLGNFLTDVADAIRTKKGSEEPIAAADFDTEIENLPSGGDLSEYFSDTISQGYTNAPGWTRTIKKLPQFEVTGTSASVMFTNYLGEALDLTGMDFSNVTNMSSMFSGCTFLRKIIFGNFDSSNVTNMDSMFYNCSQRAENLPLEIDFSKIDTSSVTNMSNMFAYFGRNITTAGTGKILTLDLSSFDTSNVTKMNSMFNWAEQISSLDLSNFNTSNVTNMSNMFGYCYYLTHLDIRNFTFDAVTSYNGMFTNVSKSCEIIVKSQTEKDWILGVRSDFTNVKTVAEYEAEQNA